MRAADGTVEVVPGFALGKVPGPAGFPCPKNDGPGTSGAGSGIKGVAPGGMMGVVDDGNMQGRRVAPFAVVMPKGAITGKKSTPCNTPRKLRTPEQGRGDKP